MAIAMVGVVSVVALPFFVQRVAELRAAGSRGNFIPAGLAALTRFTDVDGDGFSSLYFGGDCAPFNARIHRAAVDAAANGRDENCDGYDANVSQGLPREPVSAGHWRGKPQPRFNVLWIVVDALRADATSFRATRAPRRLGCRDWQASPWSSRTRTPKSSTAHLSISSMLTGKIVERMSWEYARDSARLEADERHRTLAQRLAALKYRSAAIVSAFIARLPSLMRGFDQVITGHRRGSGYDGPGASAAALDLIHASARLHESSAPSTAVDPFFLFAYYEDPHMPYSDHGEGYPRFGTSDRDLYDGEIAYVDRHIAAMLEHLESHPSVWDNTVVVLTADHGEEFGEHGGTAHGKSCYQESTHVPLLIRVPGMAPRRIAETVSLVDVVPTLLEAAGASEYGDLDGRSLLGAGAGTTTQTPSFCAITNQGTTLKGRPFFERSVRYGNRSLVERPLTGELELFDSRADGAERHNIAAEPDEAATVAELKRLLTLNAAGNFFDLRLGGPSAQLGARYSSTRPPEQGAAH